MDALQFFLVLIESGCYTFVEETAARNRRRLFNHQGSWEVLCTDFRQQKEQRETCVDKLVFFADKGQILSQKVVKQRGAIFQNVHCTFYRREDEKRRQHQILDVEFWIFIGEGAERQKQSMSSTHCSFGVIEWNKKSHSMHPLMFLDKSGY